MRKASLSRMPMTIAWALSHSFLRRWERALRCLSADRVMKAVEESRSSSQRPAVAKNLDPIPEFIAQRAEQAGFRVPYAQRLAAAQRAESERDLARFFVDLRPGPASARSSASVTTLRICAELSFGSLDATR